MLSSKDLNKKMGCTTSDIETDHSLPESPPEATPPSDLSELHTVEIKKLLQREVFREDDSSDENIDLLPRCTMALCRDCEFGISPNVNILECENIHHESIQLAVMQNETVNTVYFLNNLKSLVITKIKVTDYIYIYNYVVFFL